MPPVHFVQSVHLPPVAGRRRSFVFVLPVRLVTGQPLLHFVVASGLAFVASAYSFVVAFAESAGCSGRPPMPRHFVPPDLPWHLNLQQFARQ